MKIVLDFSSQFLYFWQPEAGLSQDIIAGLISHFAKVIQIYIQQLPILLERLATQGAKENRLKAKMAGGASVFQNEGKQNTFNIGLRNVDTIKTTLAEKKIPILAEDVGAHSGRWVIFDVSSGMMTIKDRTKGLTTL